MENSRNLIAQTLLTVRKLILDIKYYRNDRAHWEEDRSPVLIALAEANLASAEHRLELFVKSKGT
jgi:hypothetical protein